MSSSAQQRRSTRARVLRSLPAVLVIPVVASIAPIGVAAATTPLPPNKFKFSGALKGTLVVKPQIDCNAMTPIADSLGWLSVKLAPYSPVEWTIVVKFPRYGTWKKFNLATSYVMVSAAGHGAWFATSGTFTTKPNAGTMTITLAGHELGAKGTVHLAGSWNCG